MKEYKYKEVKRTINGKKYNVIVPEKHSIIDALLYEVVDLNAWDSYANITNWHTLCMVLRKGEKNWEILYNGLTLNFELNNTIIKNKGIYHILFQLETKKIRDNITKRAEIKELKLRIKRDSQRLKELEIEK